MDLQKTVSDSVNDLMLAEVSRRVNDPKYVPAVKVPPDLLASFCLFVFVCVFSNVFYSSFTIYVSFSMLISRVL